MVDRASRGGRQYQDRQVCPQDNTRYARNIPPSINRPNTVFGAPKQPKVQPLNLDGVRSFDTKTNGLFGRQYNHKTNLLNIAQQNLGLIEVTPQEYAKLTPAQKQKTQMKIVAKMGGQADHQWCAYTVSYLALEAGMNIGGKKASVQQFVNWAQNNGTYRAIKTNTVTSANLATERQKRATQIKEQLPKMHEGDFIVWKTNYGVKTNEGFKSKQSSHIGIIEAVDTKRGVVTVIEGNANEFFDPDGQGPQERTIAHGQAQRTNGCQDEGDFREVNRRDGLIRKEYTIEELANFGYSGFIDNSKIIK